jgi:CubicO group peptidase (beta-lactamase class C family)
VPLLCTLHNIYGWVGKKHATAVNMYYIFDANIYKTGICRKHLFMRKILLVIFLSFPLFVLAQSTSEKLNEYMQAAEKAGLFNGSVLVVQNGKVLLQQGYGVRDADAKILNDENTIYQIGSVTKQFTSAIILRLAEAGKLSLTDKVSKYLPDFPNAEKITIENLLSHTSGIYNYTNNGEFMEKEVEKSIDRNALYAMVKDKPLEFEPGSKMSYSNTGYMLLGYIIEKVTGRKYEDVVRTEIFQPLQMTNSGFDFKNLKAANKAIGYSGIQNGKGNKSMIVDSTVSFAAGAIYSTLGDLNKWNNAVLSEKIMKKASLENAFTPRHSKYGLGWSVDSVAGKRMIAHGGGIHGFLSYNLAIPEENTSVILLTNVSTSKPGKASQDIVAILHNKPYTLPEVKKEIAVDEKILQQYVGEYELAPTFVITVSVEDGALKAQPTNQPKVDLYATSETEFFLKVVDAKVVFVKNDKGEVEKLILHQNGREIPGVKRK